MKVLITGANRGLGLCIAKELLNRGHLVIAGVRSMERLDGLGSLMEEYQENIIPVNIDVSREETIKSTVINVKESIGAIDGIINNAGILLGRERTAEQLDIEEIKLNFEVNTFGPMMVVKHFLPLISETGTPIILNITSEAANDLGPRDYGYSMSKAATNMYSIKLSSYLGERGVRVYAIHPGWIRTDMGGENAPGSPEETARGIADILEGTLVPEDIFTDFRGSPM